MFEVPDKKAVFFITKIFQPFLYHDGFNCFGQDQNMVLIVKFSNEYLFFVAHFGRNLDVTKTF